MKLCRCSATLSFPMGAKGRSRCGRPSSARCAVGCQPLDQGPYRHLWLDAIAIRVREEGQVVSVAAVVATAVNALGLREIMGLDVPPEGACLRDESGADGS